MSTKKFVKVSSNGILPLLAFLVMALCFSCYSDREGCKDAAAVNFDAKADVNCCCKYPELNLLFSYHYDTLGYRQNQLVHDVNDEPYMLSGFQLGLHAVLLLDSEGESHAFPDTFLYNSQEVVVSKTIAIANTNSNFMAGEINNEIDYNYLTFRTGIDRDFYSYAFANIRGNTEMTRSLSELYYKGKWYDGFLKYIPDTARLDSIKTLYFTVESERVELGGDYLPQYGRNLRIPLMMDLKEVLVDFDSRADTTTQVLQLKTGWARSVSLDFD